MHISTYHDCNYSLNRLSLRVFEILPITDKKSALVTLAIGKDYLESWEKFALPSWIQYCKKYGIGLFVEDQNLDRDEFPKKKQWQKLLLGAKLLELEPDLSTFCYLDTDILINPYSPDIFSFHSSGKISLVSSINQLPFDRSLILRRVAFFRKKFIDSTYPLDSALFITNSEMYNYHKVSVQPDYACTGLIMCDASAAPFLKEIFYKYKMPVESITDGGEEPLVNYEIQSNMPVNWLDYKFQAQWIYEIAWNYPFLYMKNNRKFSAECIRISLMNNYFLHFSGSWSEGHDWENPNIFNSKFWNSTLHEFYDYMSIPVYGKPVGKLLPGKKDYGLLRFFKKKLNFF
jgi:hypothetical protein